MKFLHNLKISILSWLLHYANQNGKDERFYKIKNRILANYGRHICYEVQFIEGKKCRSCGGTGKYIGYGYYGKFVNPCYNCYNGWYKRPEWNILALVRFGKYEFHQPFMRVYEDPKFKGKTFTGYVERYPTKLTVFAIIVLFLVYEKGYLRRLWKISGIGWRFHWWNPKNWIHNFIHIIKFGFEIPWRRIKQSIHCIYTAQKTIVFDLSEDDLPF